MIDRPTYALMEKFGAEFAVNKKPLPEMSRLARAVNRNNLNKGAQHPYEFPSEGQPARLTILWDQYRKRDHLARVAMRRALMACQVDDADVAQVWAVPRELRDPPLPAALAANLDRTMTALQLAGSEHVVLVGSQVIAMWSSKARITRVAGHGYVWGMYYVYPAYNPLALGHQLDMREYRKAFDKIAFGLSEGSILATLDPMCHDKDCDKKAAVYDAKARGWCDRHYSPARFNKEETTWKTEANKSNQQTLL